MQKRHSPQPRTLHNGPAPEEVLRIRSGQNQRKPSLRAAARGNDRKEGLRDKASGRTAAGPKASQQELLLQ